MTDKYYLLILKKDNGDIEKHPCTFNSGACPEEYCKTLVGVDRTFANGDRAPKIVSYEIFNLQISEKYSV